MSSREYINNKSKGLQDQIKNYKLSDVYDNDFHRYIDGLLKKGKIEQAVNAWNNRTPKDMLHSWGVTIQTYMEWAVADVRTASEVNLLSGKISLITREVKNTLLESHKAFLTDIIAPYYKDLYNVGSADMYKTIVNASIAQFESYVQGALTNTPQHILTDIRQFQLELHNHHQAINKLDNLDNYIDDIERQFKTRMKKKFPSYFQSMQDGKVIKSRWYGKNLDKVKAYSLDEYAEMMARPTVLNIDRACSLAHALNAKHKVIEYVVLDNRTLKTDEERQICKTILNNKIHGKALLALDEETAILLNLQTVTTAKNKGAMYIHCRHGIRPVSNDFHQQVEKILFLKKQMLETKTG